MSTLVSNVYPFTEKIHKDFQSNLLHENLDLSYSMMGKNLAPGGLDNFSLLNSAQLVGAWASQRPVNAPRRNSTSSMSPIAATRNRMNMSALTSAANVIPESSATTLSAAASILNSLSEERFRGRAYSEGASSLSGDNQLPPQQQQPIASSRYKTELCRPFEENGKCKYGDKCQFAHGKQELRQLIRHPKYKTELCRTFHTSGFCPYGPRCHFIHNQDDSARSGNAAMQPPVSNASIHHQQAPHVNAYNNGLMAAPGLPIPIPAPQTPDRHLYDRRPGRLNVLSKQLSAGPTFGSLSYSPTSQGSPNHSPTYFPGGMHGSALMSPTSPNSASNGSMFTFNNVQPTVGPGTIMSSMPYEAVQQSTPPLSNFELFQSQGALFEHQGDDGAFDAPPTPPDSDRESMTGSPSGKQRLPIFRCLSQSE